MVCYSPWACKELDMTEQLSNNKQCYKFCHTAPFIAGMYIYVYTYMYRKQFLDPLFGTFVMAEVKGPAISLPKFQSVAAS